MDLRQARIADPSFPPVLFVYPGTVGDGETFFGTFDPGARALADPTARLHEAFGIEQASLGQLLGPRVWACGLRAGRKGHRLGKPVGDAWRMHGLFLVEGGCISWRHRPRHAGDFPDYADIPRAAAR